MKFLLIDDHALIREALRGVLKELRRDGDVLEAANCDQAKRLVGNFPQAFSHLALIGTALNLRDVGPAQQRAQGAPPAVRSDGIST